MNEPAFYLNVIHNFVENGEEPDLSLLAQPDAVLEYLAHTMHDAEVKALVLNDEIAAQVFTDTMLQFVRLNQEKAAYQMQRTSFERKQIEEATTWNLTKRRDNWQALVQMMDDKYAEQGFDKGFYLHEMETAQGYADDALWQTMLDDWQYHLDLRLQLKQRDFAQSRKDLQNLTLRNNLKGATQYVKEHDITQHEFFQAGALMGGRWNT